MKRRTRRIAGTFALVALTFTLAETVLASTCAPAMEMRAADSTVAQQLPADDCVVATNYQRENRGDDERQCPFGPAAAAQGCAGVASLPAHTVDAVTPSLEGAIAVFVEPTQHDLLVENALFHPPRA